MFRKIIPFVLMMLVSIPTYALPQVSQTDETKKIIRNLDVYYQILLLEEAGKRDVARQLKDNVNQREQARAEKKPRFIKASFVRETPVRKQRSHRVEPRPAPKAALKKSRFMPRERSFRVYKNHLRVTATAYTSHVNQTDSTPNIAAWGDRLKSGMKVIAVSRDLLNQYGMQRGTKVKIKGLPGEYLVLDKMNKRWRKKIDIYMGLDKRKAFKWGRRKVEIMWN